MKTLPVHRAKMINLKKMMNDLKNVVELSTRAQGGNSDQGVGREESSTGVSARGATTVEYAGERVADVTDRIPAALQPQVSGRYQQD